MLFPDREGTFFMENNVELRGLCRRFSGKVALDGLTFRMDGGVFGLLGGKGAGKSTLLRILATLLPGDGGEALVCGLPLARAGAVRAIVGYLPEDFCFYGGLRAGEAMDYLGALSGLDALTRRARTAQLLERVGLDGQAQTHIRRFDTGMLRRLGVDIAVSSTDNLARILEREVETAAIQQVLNLAGGTATVFEIQIPDRFKYNGKSLAQIPISESAVIIAITRAGELLIPRGNTQILNGDKVLCVARDTAIHELMQDWGLASG